LKEKEAKVETALKMWVPGVNAEGRFGRWAFLEIDNPWNAKTAIRDFLEGRKA
jgi:type III restriction enzyme